MSRSNKRLNRRKYNRDICKVLYGLKSIIKIVNDEHGINKMFLCVNSNNKNDVAVISYVGNEKLEASLGADNVLQFENVIRHNQLIVKAEVLLDGSIIISDGQVTYEIDTLR